MNPPPELLLPTGVRSRFIEGVNGLRMHVLEGGDADDPLALLLHGFPELAFSWRKVIAPLAAAGFHIVAPDMRGYGRTTGWSADYDSDFNPFRMLSLAEDVAALAAALGRESVAAVVGHDFGSPVAAWCALTRPDVFRAVALISAPFAGPPAPPSGPALDIDGVLAKLERPRKHYVSYYSTRQANTDMLKSRQGLHAFLRAYYHVKGADWAGNRPHPLAGWTATELAKLPTYYVLDRDADMPATVAPFMPSASEVAACNWLTEAELAVYAQEFGRTGFQGGLNWYRGISDGNSRDELRFTGRTIDVPAIFIAGASDWGVHQSPGAFDAMQTRICTRFQGAHLIDGAGHWVQQEQPEEVTRLLLTFFAGLP